MSELLSVIHQKSMVDSTLGRSKAWEGIEQLLSA
jgi:hypothetical protein